MCIVYSYVYSYPRVTKKMENSQFSNRLGASSNECDICKMHFGTFLKHLPYEEENKRTILLALYIRLEYSYFD